MQSYVSCINSRNNYYSHFQCFHSCAPNCSILHHPLGLVTVFVLILHSSHPSMKPADLFYNLVSIDGAHEPGLHPNLQSRLWFWKFTQSSDTSDLCQVLGTECLGPCPARRSLPTCWLPRCVLFSHSCLQDDLAITTLLVILNNKPQRRHNFLSKRICTNV